ncbi:hypothetical protein IR152_15100 [Clostridioides sp. ES-S-0108-01]|uniref:hypothetical protein n=1 Tax=Clostridioides sp. ES-S-0108-01 TaxID=2770773 RepID=UPI001D0CBB5A|nr:hypothetical protein [Clostridioides sp. ES-S-0108-01]UDN51591.1 hypothetical protein JJC16_02570 [Clostridioides sp. ES-S-0107-01]
MFEKFNVLKRWQKILIIIIGILLLPLTLLLFSILFLVKSISKKSNKLLKILKIAISLVLIFILSIFNWVWWGEMFKMVTDPNYSTELNEQQERERKEEELKDKETKEKQELKDELENQKKKELEEKKKQEDLELAKKEKAEKERVEKENSKNGIRFNTVDEVKNLYKKNQEKITKREKVRDDLNWKEITLQNVLNHASNSKKLLGKLENVSDKIDLSMQIVAVDDLHHNTSQKIMKETLEYMIKEYKNSKLDNKEKLEDYLYITRYLDSKLKSYPEYKQKQEAIYQMYNLTKDRLRKIDTSSDIEKIDKALGIYVEKAKEKVEAPKPKIEESSKYSENQQTSETVYANGGSSKSNKYHSSPTAHNMEGAIPMSREEAESKGYVACKRCY